MQRQSILYGALMTALGLLPVGKALAVDWGGSYAVGESCHCTGTLTPGMAEKQLATPIGGQTIAQICKRLGPGPGLTLIDGRFDHTIYPDVQCGNGPFAEDTELLDAQCAGTRAPGLDDCQPVGPRWDLEALYAVDEAVDPVLGQAVPTDESAQPDLAEPADAARQVPVLAFETVEIDGKRWRQAPAGTQVSGGASGSRIILDGDVWLLADDPVFAAQQKLEAHRTRVTARDSSNELQPRLAAAQPAIVEESPAMLRKRQRELVAQARLRAADRRKAGIDQDPVVFTEVADPAPDDTEAALAVDGDADLPAAPLALAVPDEAVEDATAADLVEDELAADTVVEQSGNAADEQAVPVSALRLPIDARSSSRDFGYLQAMPVSYDIGGAGVMLEGSAEMRNRYHVVARAGVANKYQEFLLGAGLHYTPPNADRLTLLVTAGLEYGVFPLENAQTGLKVDDASSGFFLQAGSRLVLNSKFELEGGVGFSSFHEGDPNAFGGGYFHINDSVDLMSRFEVGDQNAYGIGVRVYY